MSVSVSGPAIAEVFSSLGRTFGERLSFTRRGSTAQWSFDGHLALVELAGEDRVHARFVAPAETERGSGAACSAIYAPHGDGYALTRAGCERMAADIVAFFSGTREPLFTFIGAR